MDLLGRKMGMKNGGLFRHFLEEAKKTADEASRSPELSPLSGNLLAALDLLETTGMELSKSAVSPSIRSAYAQSFPFLEVTGDVIMAWMLLWRACTATKALASNPKKKDIDYYQGIIKTAEFFISNQLPASRGKMTAIARQNTAVLDISDTCFGG
jgi:hypothetical protein